MVKTGVAPCVPECGDQRHLRGSELSDLGTDPREGTVRSRRATRGAGGRRGPRRPRGATAHADRLNLQNVPLGSELCPSLSVLRRATSKERLRDCEDIHERAQSVCDSNFNITAKCESIENSATTCRYVVDVPVSPRIR